jgi:periplasmic divalent cation tolerance protein
MSQETVVVLVTASSAEEADLIARDLVGEKLVACANLVPGVTSIFRWKGKIETSSEVLMVLKTRRRLLDRLVDRVKALHSYEVPEVIALPLSGGSREYIEWLLAETEEAARMLPRDRRGTFGPGF